MIKIFPLLIALCCSSSVIAQTDTLSVEDMRLLDSMFRNDEFIKLMFAKNKKSYVDLNVGMGNSIFSKKNNALNAGQAQTNKLYFTPSVGYYHKSGLAFYVTGYLTNDDGALKIYQYAVSPSYNFSNKNFEAGISYTRYIEGSGTSFEINPFKNDFYVNGVYKKTWVEPGIALGYSFGKQEEYYDTAFWFLNRIVHIRDTITTRLSGLSLTVSAAHEWNFYRLLNKKDALQLQSAVLMNAGSQKWNITHSSSLFDRRPVVQTYLKRRFGEGTTSSAFNIQSAAFSVTCTYYYGKFYLQPQLYLDYYLPETSEKRLTSLFSVTAGFSFY